MNAKEEKQNDKYITDDYWINIFNSILGSSDNKTPYKELLRSLDNFLWTSKRLENILSRYRAEQKVYLLSVIKYIYVCLSNNNQKQIIELLRINNIDCDNNPHHISVLQEAIECSNLNYDDNCNIFKLFDILFDEKQLRVVSKNTENILIQILNWTSNENLSLSDYSVLPKIILCLSEDDKLKIIKRYFYDIKENRTIFSPKLIEEILDGRKNKYSFFRHFLCKSTGKTELAAYLLCECVLNIQGQKDVNF